MTFGVIEKEEPFLGQLIALAFRAFGHHCLILRDADHAVRILNATRIDSLVVDIQMPGRNGVDWLETWVTTWPDLPSRTLLLTRAALTPGETGRIRRLGAEVVFRPLSLESIKLLVIGRLHKARSNPAGNSQRGREQVPSISLLN
jgi:DNA-binding response OmpR family regulator